jgi:hypothetical protein
MKMTLSVFLPQDNESLQSERVVLYLNHVLRNALEQKSRTSFLKLIDEDASQVRKIVNSYLQYRMRPFEKAFDVPPSREEENLSRRVFLVLKRLVAVAAAATDEGLKTGTTTTTIDDDDDVVKMLRRRKIFTLAKLIDIATLFAEDNADLVRDLFINVHALLPEIFHRQLDETLFLLSKNFNDIMVSMMKEKTEEEDISRDDMLLYLRDAAISLKKFIDVLPERTTIDTRSAFVTTVEALQKFLTTIHNNKNNKNKFLEHTIKCFNELMYSIKSIKDEEENDNNKKETTTSQKAISSNYDSDDDLAALKIVEQVRVVLPDYGVGFLKACVNVFGFSAELIIQNILEGPLPKELSSLDTKMPYVIIKPSVASAEITKTKILNAKADGFFLSAKKYTTEAKNVLDKNSASNRAAVLRLLENIEYEDEYDASFDDLPPAPMLVQTEENEIENANAMLRNFWVFEGRVYNAPKEGAKIIKARSPMEATNIADASEAQEESTFGLGKGGNKAVFQRDDDDGGDSNNRSSKRNNSNNNHRGGAASSSKSISERNRRKAAATKKRNVL